MSSGSGANATQNPTTCPAPDPGPPSSTSTIVNVLFILFSCKLSHHTLSHFNQPRIVSELIVGFLLGNVSFLNPIARGPLENGFRVMDGFSASLYMFVLGLEMEPLSILSTSGAEAMIAYAGIFATCTIYISAHAFFLPYKLLSYLLVRLRMIAVFSVMFSATSSPIVTRLITELKLGQSDIGRLAIRTGLANDLVCTALMCVFMVLRDSKREVLIILVSVAAEMIFVVSVLRLLFRWANDRSPEGKPVKGLDMTIVVLSTQILCHSATFFYYDAKVNSFLIGLALPRQGRVSNFLISKINFAMTTFVLPLYLSMAAMKATFIDDNDKLFSSWAKTVMITVLATLGKILGTLAIGLRIGLHWLEAVTLGIVLSMKGYFLVFFSMEARNMGIMGSSEFMVMVLVVMISIAYVPFTVPIIVKRLRTIKGSGTLRPMSLQWLSALDQLRITIGLHGSHNVPATMNLIEMMSAGSDSEVVVYAIDMVELTEQNKAALIYREGTDEVTVADETVIKLREQIGKSLDAYLDSEGAVKLHRSLAISSFSNMHDDICCNAQDNLVAFIVLPFHKSLQPDGTMDTGHQGFRTVNENVLQHTTSSVGILVDRGLGQNNKSSTADTLTNVAVIFMGGADDREALACAGIIAGHPMVRLMVIRILPDTEAMAADGAGRHIYTEMPHRKKEMEMDDEYFAGFYEKHVTNGKVGYMEKYVKDGAEAVLLLREVQEKYQLFIVGQGQDRNSVLTAGLSEWAECPELGPIGDVLACSDFPGNSSVLVIQQYDPARHSEYANNAPSAG